MLSLIAIIFLKVLLWGYCKSVKSLLVASRSGESSTSIEAMAQDHINDCLSNGVAVVCVFFATLPGVGDTLWWLDPAGAILISVYIMWSWYETGSEEIEKIVGKAANQDMIDLLTKIGNTHDDNLTVDILRCYHFGEQFLVEMEVILPAEMALKDTHDIGMSLQYKLEKVPEVERAFVHIDYKKRAYDEHVNSRVYDSYQHQKSIDEEVERAQSPAGSSTSTTSYEII